MRIEGREVVIEEGDSRLPAHVFHRRLAEALAEIDRRQATARRRRQAAAHPSLFDPPRR